jgi:hypothetical protein
MTRTVIAAMSIVLLALCRTNPSLTWVTGLAFVAVICSIALLDYRDRKGRDEPGAGPPTNV